MRTHQLEALVFDVIEKIERREPCEDDKIELKSALISDTKKAARQIAGQANAARGEDVIWIIGIDEKKGIIGAKHKEISKWYSAVVSSFDDRCSPSLRTLNVSYKNKTIVALLFKTDRAPFVVKNESGGQITREVPWREANSTRSAYRTDLLKLLSPLQEQPYLDFIEGSMQVIKNEKEEGGTSIVKYHWHLSLNFYIIPKSQSLMVMPFHLAEMQILSDIFKKTVNFQSINIGPKKRSIFTRNRPLLKTEILSFTIENTPDEVLIKGPGLMVLCSETITNKLPININSEVKFKISLPVLPYDTVNLYGELRYINKPGKEFLHEWGFKK